LSDILYENKLDSLFILKYIIPMNKKFIKSIVLAIFIAQFNLVFAGAMIAEPGLTAVSDGQSVKLTWQTTSEENLQSFIVERKASDGEFIQIATMSPEDDQYYEYVDRNAYKTEDAVYIYRLSIVETSGSVSHSGEASVLHNVSSVRRTWGSIKALFR